VNGNKLVVSVVWASLGLSLGCGPKSTDNPEPTKQSSRPPMGKPDGAGPQVTRDAASPAGDAGAQQQSDAARAPDGSPDPMGTHTDPDAGPGPVLGASGDTPPPALSQLVETPQVKAPWTILVYGHGDHNLSNSLLRDMREMQAATLGNNVQLLVVADFDASQQIAGSTFNYPDGLGLYQVFGDNADLVEVARGTEANLDDPAVLTDLVGAVFAAYPSERRGLILWDHGGGWEAGFGSDTQNGTLANPEPMAIEAAATAVLAGLAAAGVTDEPGLDFFSFDTCLLGGAEAAYAFKDVAQVYIANAELDYGNGWDYERTLSYFAAHPDATMAALATREVADWDAHHVSAGVDDTLLRSHVALDLAEVGGFAAAISELSAALTNGSEHDPIELARSSFFALPPYSSEFASGSDEPGLRDVGQLLRDLQANSSDEAVVNAARDATQALGRLVLAQSQGALRADSGQVGLSIEQTLGAQLTQARLSSYDQHAAGWVAASRWDLVLAFAAAAADDEPPAFEHVVTSGSPASAEEPPVLEFSSEDPTLAKAEVHLGVYLQDGSTAVLGLVGSGIVEGGGGAYDFTWDGTVFGFEDLQPAALRVWLDVGNASESTVYAIPGRLRSAGGDWYVQLVAGASEETVSAVVVWEGESPSTWSIAELVQSLPDATFTPVYEGLDAQGRSIELEGDPIPMPATGFTLAPQYLGAGDYMFVTALTDVWGNTGAELDTFTLESSLEP
jgi:Clostripain family